MAKSRSGRGATHNPANRFLALELERADDFYEGAFAGDRGERPPTQFLQDCSRSIVSTNDSPDLAMDATLNSYRGCEHGCAYCFARPTHEYLGFSAGLDFEMNVLVKKDAPRLLREHLSKPRYKPVTISMSGVTDPYQPVERHLCLTRGCLEVFLEFRNPTAVVTKNFLVTRDIDILAGLAQYHCAQVLLSITTLDPDLANRMEPRAASPARRLEAIRRLTSAGIPTSVLAAPMIPGLTDHELPAIIAAAAEHGAHDVSYIPLRLPGAVLPVFTEWLQNEYPDRAEKVLNRIRSMRGGKLNDSNFHTRFRGEGPVADTLLQLHKLARRKAGLPRPVPPLSTEHFRRPGPQQLHLF